MPKTWRATSLKATVAATDGDQTDVFNPTPMPKPAGFGWNHHAGLRLHFRDKAFCRAIAPRIEELGFGVRLKVLRSTAIKPYFGL